MSSTRIHRECSPWTGELLLLLEDPDQRQVEHLLDVKVPQKLSLVFIQQQVSF